jgi:putative MFS transporter
MPLLPSGSCSSRVVDFQKFRPLNGAMWTYTLMSEFMPARKRGLLMGMWALFLPLGLMMTAQISAWVIPNWGWQMLSLIGAAPAVAALFVRRFIPESPRFLIQRGRIDEARQSLLWVSGGHALPAQVEAALVGLRKVPQKQDKKLSVVELFRPDYRVRTSFAWVFWFCNIFCYLGLTPWLPTLLTKFKGIPATEIFTFMTVYAAIGIVGRLAVAGTVDYVGRRPLLIILGAGGTISLWMLGQQTTLSGLQFWGWSVAFFLEGMTGLLAALTPELFPTRFRATGIGWAQGVGRVGGILAPLAVGAVVVSSVASIFTMFAAAYAGIIIAGWLFRIETKGQSLEVTSQDTSVVSNART